jgi:hypothetical protein
MPKLFEIVLGSVAPPVNPFERPKPDATPKDCERLLWLLRHFPNANTR